MVRTQVAIIGAGPAGMMLAHMLRGEGVDCVVLERRSRDYVEGRVRAGLLEQVTVEMMERLGLADRLHRESLSHAGVNIAHEGSTLHIDFNELTGGTNLTVYGQQEVMKDLFDAAPERGIEVLFEAEDVTPSGIETDRPTVSYVHGGEAHTLECDIVAGCDGFHGVSRGCIPASVLRSFEKVYPFGWLGILADVPPCSEELIYCNHPRGFALASMRSHTRSRCYIQCSLDDDIADWSDDRFWDEFALRIGPEAASRLVRGPSIEKSIAPLRSFVAEPMRHGRLFLAGDAAHIVPPTGAKGLNLAATDVLMLSEFDLRLLFHRPGRGAGRLFGAGPGAGVEGRAVLLVADQPDPPLPRDRAHGAPLPGGGAGLHQGLPRRPDVLRRELRRPVGELSGRLGEGRGRSAWPGQYRAGISGRG